MTTYKTKLLYPILIILCLVLTLIIGISLVKQRQLINKEAATPTGTAEFKILENPLISVSGQVKQLALYLNIPSTPNNQGIIGFRASLEYDPSLIKFDLTSLQNTIGQEDSSWSITTPQVVVSQKKQLLVVEGVYNKSGLTGYIPYDRVIQIGTINFTPIHSGTTILKFNTDPTDPYQSYVYSKYQNQDILSNLSSSNQVITHPSPSSVEIPVTCQNNNMFTDTFNAPQLTGWNTTVTTAEYNLDNNRLNVTLDTNKVFNISNQQLNPLSNDFITQVDLYPVNPAGSNFAAYNQVFRLTNPGNSSDINVQRYLYPDGSNRLQAVSFNSNWSSPLINLTSTQGPVYIRVARQGGTIYIDYDLGDGAYRRLYTGPVSTDAYTTNLTAFGSFTGPRTISFDNFSVCEAYTVVAPTNNAIDWSTPYAHIKADNFFIKADGKIFLGIPDPGTLMNISSDPGNTTYQTLEVTWTERGYPMRLYSYFGANGQNWYTTEVRTYNGQPNGDWIYYNPGWGDVIGQEERTTTDPSANVAIFPTNDPTALQGHSINWRNIRIGAFKNLSNCPNSYPCITPTTTPTVQPPTPTRIIIGDKVESLTFSVKYQGVNVDPATKSQTVKVSLRAANQDVYTQDVVMAYEPGSIGVYKGTLQNATIGNGYGLVPGAYQVSIKGASHLRKNLGFVSLGFGANSAPITWINTPLITGDVNEDNILNSVDLSLLLSARTSLLGVPVNQNNKVYDLNFDGIINSVDLSLLLSARTSREVFGDAN